MTSNIAERADAYKDAVRANYENQQENFLAQKTNVNNQKAAATAQAASGLANAAQGLGEGLGDAKLGDLFKKKTWV